MRLLSYIFIAIVASICVAHVQCSPVTMIKDTVQKTIGALVPGFAGGKGSDKVPTSPDAEAPAETPREKRSTGEEKKPKKGFFRRIIKKLTPGHKRKDAVEQPQIVPQPMEHIYRETPKPSQPDERELLQKLELERIEAEDEIAEEKAEEMAEKKAEEMAEEMAEQKAEEIAEQKAEAIAEEKAEEIAEQKAEEAKDDEKPVEKVEDAVVDKVEDKSESAQEIQEEPKIEAETVAKSDDKKDDKKDADSQ